MNYCPLTICNTTRYVPEVALRTYRRKDDAVADAMRAERDPTIHDAARRNELMRGYMRVIQSANRTIAMRGWHSHPYDERSAEYLRKLGHTLSL